MKKTLLKTALASILLLPLVAAAEVPAHRPPPAWGEIDFMTALEKITNSLFAILLIVAALAIIIAGYYFVTAAGDTEKTKKARDFVLYALVGVLVAFIAKGMVYLVDTILR
jgi:hypothetical protein